MGDVPTYLFTQGVLGVACLALAWVCGKLYRKCELLSDRIEALHEKRLADSMAQVEKLAQVLESNTESNRLLTEKIDIAKGK